MHNGVTYSTGNCVWLGHFAIQQTWKTLLINYTLIKNKIKVKKEPKCVMCYISWCFKKSTCLHHMKVTNFLTSFLCFGKSSLSMSHLLSQVKKRQDVSSPCPLWSTGDLNSSELSQRYSKVEKLFTSVSKVCQWHREWW